MRIPQLADLTGFASHSYESLVEKSQAVGYWIADDPRLFLMFFFLALIPAIFWMWLFIRKNHMDKVHKRYMIYTFVVGMITVLPVFFVDSAAARLFNIHLNKSLFYSAVHTPWLGRLLYFIVVVGMLEEYSKHLAVKEVDYKKRFFNRITDGIEFSVAAALGFAFIENIIYFNQAWEVLATKKEFVGVVVVRSAGSMLAHVLFSGIFGYYYGRAKFIDDEERTDRSKHLHMHLLDGIKTRYSRIKHTLSGSHILVEIGHRLRRDEIIGEGLLIAMLLHGFYDFFLDINLTYLIVPLIFGEFMFIWHELEVTENTSVHEAKDWS
jgi:RsiW-degrading membrane proteinase PrsW (M82 family)